MPAKSDHLKSVLRLIQRSNSKSLMCAYAIIGLLLFTANLQATRVTEQEPNNELTQPNTVICGDTVMCATLHPGNDLDHYRCFVNAGDSIVMTTFTCTGGNTNTFMVLYNDHDSVLATDNNSGPGLFSSIQYLVHQSGYYTLRVMGIAIATDSAYNLFVDCRLPIPDDYDLCTSPRVIDSLPYFNEGTTYGMTSQLGWPAPDVFYLFHNPVTTNYLIEVCTNEFDARVQLMGDCINDYREDESIGCGLGATLQVFSLPPGDYFIMVEGMSAMQFGDFTISVNAPLPDCPPPEPVVITMIGGLPFLDWPEIQGPSYYIIWQSNNSEGPWEHLGISFLTYYADSLGFTGNKRFYQVTSMCPW
jgi:hypothetical protein